VGNRLWADDRNKGAWVGNNKLGSIGIKITRGISYHGLALNVNTKLHPFSWINPCGLQDIGITSMKKELSKSIPMDSIRKLMKHHISKIFHLTLVNSTLNDLKRNLSHLSHEKCGIAI